ncbi:MAG: DAK2 domain-containing protein [Acidimicrobiales bacterium]
MGQSSPDTSLERLLKSLIDHEEEFRELDAAAGDGDLGITVRSAATAILEWLRKDGTVASTKELLAGMAQVCGSTSPSTFGSLASHGLAAAARALGDEPRDDLSSLVVALEAGIAMVQRRGRAEPGEKTFLDALIPALQAARSATSVAEALPLMRVAAIAGTEQMAPAAPKHGRAAWVGERASGIPDAGSVVVIRALEALEGPAAPPWDVGKASQP